MSSEPLRNAWIAASDPVIAWVADLTAAADRPHDLLAWQTELLRAGREQAVYMVRAAPEAGYEGDGPLEQLLAARSAAEGTAVPFGFARSGRAGGLRVAARLAYVEDGHVVEREVEDPGELLARLRPDDVAAAGSRMTRNAPVDVHPAGGRVIISSFTDIWLPLVPGLLEDDYELGRPFDNRALAERHTPRLNAWLALARDRTRVLGGDWRLHPDFTRADPALLDGDGLIRL